jgi:hypothetical protein
VKNRNKKNIINDQTDETGQENVTQSEKNVRRKEKDEDKTKKGKKRIFTEGVIG